MTFQTDIASDVQNLAVGNIVSLYELDLTTIGGTDVLYFTEVIDEDYTPISFNAREYTPIHMKTEGWQVTGNDTLPRPKIYVSNVLLTFASYINSFESLVGAEFTRRRTLEKYLDGKPEANPAAEFDPDVFKIRTMPQKTKAIAEFELSAYMDYEGIKIPKRQILSDFCSQTYRKWDDDAGAFDYTYATCPYTGDYCFDRLGEYTATDSEDVCGKELADCEMRYAGVRAARIAARLGTDIYIQATEPLSPNIKDFWLNTDTAPNIWYFYQNPTAGWVTLETDPLPTYAFPSVARFRI